MHVRSIDGYIFIGTFHVVVSEYKQEIKEKIREELIEHGIIHSTIELELENENCNNKECKLEMPKGHHHH